MIYGITSGCGQRRRLIADLRRTTVDSGNVYEEWLPNVCELNHMTALVPSRRLAAAQRGIGDVSGEAEAAPVVGCAVRCRSFSDCGKPCEHVSMMQ